MPEEIEAAKRDMDERTFKQEYLAQWVDYSGLIYYAFGEHNIVKRDNAYLIQAQCYMWELTLTSRLCVLL